MNEANLREIRNVVRAMTYEEQIAVAETLDDEVIAQIFSLRLTEYGKNIRELKERIRSM